MATGVIQLETVHVSVLGVKRPFNVVHVGNAARRLRPADHLAPETYRLPKEPKTTCDALDETHETRGLSNRDGSSSLNSPQMPPIPGSLAKTVSPAAEELYGSGIVGWTPGPKPCDYDFDLFYQGMVGGNTLQNQLERHAKALDARPKDYFQTRGFVDGVGGGAPNMHETFTDELHYCKRHKLWMNAKKKITGGTLLFVTDQSNKRMVIKNQRIDLPSTDILDIAPGAWCTELQALVSLRFLMSVKGVPPLFCELLHNETYRDSQRGVMYSSMRLARYETSLLDWLMCSKCPTKPAVNVSADPGDAWTLSSGGGRALALSSHASDVRLFNAILRAVIFQVFLAIATAQRHLRFSHNDLHIGNVMIGGDLVDGVKKFVSGFGTFTLQNKCPTVRIIDFQHAAFDLIRSDGTFERRVRGYPTSWSNERGLLYDTWRFASHLLLEGLHTVLPAVDEDLRNFLWATAQLPGTFVIGKPPPKIPSERHWTPNLMTGVLPEQVLTDDHGPFRCFRGDPHASADHVFVERGDNIYPCPSERFVRTVFVQTTPTQRSLARYAEPLKSRRKKYGETDNTLARMLHAYVSNYVKRVDVSVANMSKFTVRERSAYLFRELEVFQTGMHVLWNLSAVNATALVEAGPSAVCAAADAIQCVLRNDLLWTYRASAKEHVEFFEHVKRTLSDNAALTSAAATRTPLALPCHLEQHDFLAAEHEHHLAALKGKETKSVERRVYEKQ